MGSQLSAAQVAAQVVDYAATGSTPELTSSQVDAIVVRSARPDGDGNVPADDDWTETYDVNAAIAAAWDLKATLAATRFDLTVDGQTLRRSQIIEHCERQAARFRARSAFVWPS